MAAESSCSQFEALISAAADASNLELLSSAADLQSRIDQLSTEDSDMPSDERALLSSSKTADSHLSVQLHPLVILTISDYITRHNLRKQHTPIVGAVLGVQNGRVITMEQAFECVTDTDKNGDFILDAGWFHDRLQQYKDVHKAPALDLVGWFTIASPHGPESHHCAIHNQILETYNESALMLAFHPLTAAGSPSRNGKLPLTIYESVYEAAPEDEDSTMKESGEGPSLVLRFKELPYSIETSEAEMIGIDGVAKGGPNAAPIATDTAAQNDVQKNAKGKGKARASTQEDEEVLDSQFLSPEEEDAIAALNSKANAIRMLQQRIHLLKSYLDSLPPCYLNDSSITTVEEHPQISHTILRSINSLLARLPLLTPSTPNESISSTSQTNDTQPETSAFMQESISESADVALVSLLGSMGSAVQSAQAMGRKAGIIDSAKTAAAKKQESSDLSSWMAKERSRPSDSEWSTPSKQKGSNFRNTRGKPGSR